MLNRILYSFKKDVRAAEEVRMVAGCHRFTTQQLVALALVLSTVGVALAASQIGKTCMNSIQTMSRGFGTHGNMLGTAAAHRFDFAGSVH